MKTEARELLLDLVGMADAANRGTTPERAVDDAIHEARLNEPSLRTCLFPGCLRQFDIISSMAGDQPPRPEWDGKGWAAIGSGSILSGGGHVCPGHKPVVTEHLPARVQCPNGRWTTSCACGWSPAPQRYYPLVRALWEQHLLETIGELPPAPPIPAPEHRLPYGEHDQDSLTELYDRLEDAEVEREGVREVARAAVTIYHLAIPALLGVATSLEGLRTRITLDSRDWTDDKVDALLYAVLVGVNCENDTPDHVHNDIDCAGDQGLWDLAKQHGIPIEQAMQASQHRWWIANAIKVAAQIEDANKPKED